MDINELQSYRLSDAVKFNDSLNPRLWGSDERLLPEVREKLLAIADDFREFLGIDVEVQDITISGSNAAYTYTPHSDIDLHLVADLPRADESDIYRELFDAKKYQYNDQHDFKIGGYDVELYVQNANEPHHSQGIYSVKDNRWIKVPSRRKPQVDDISVKSKYQDIGQRIDQAIESEDLSRMDAMSKKIRDMRQAGLDAHGEFGPENLAFKILRGNGTLEKLRNARLAAKNQLMSLDERKKKKKKTTRYGFGGYYFPGYHYYGQTDSASDGGDGGGESVRESQESMDLETVLKKFIAFTAKQIGIKQMPRIRFKRDPAWSQRNNTFGRYVPEENALYVSLANRHPLDIMRTVAHELTHHRQNEISSMPDYSGDTGSDWENEANAAAGIIMRRFSQLHPNYFQSLKINEVDTGQTPQPGDPIDWPEGTVHVKVSDVYDWYKLGQKISNLNTAKPEEFGGGVPETILVFNNEPQEEKFIDQLTKLGLDVHDVDPGEVPGQEQQSDIDEGWRERAAGMAAAACIAGTPGCATTGSDVARVARDVQTIGRTAQSIERMGRAGAEEELRQELKNWLNKGRGTHPDTRLPLPDIRQQKENAQKVSEASGYIPTASEKNDPRYSMALTVDIKPGQTGKEANKLGLKTDSQGRPALLMKKLANALKEFKQTENSVLLEGFSVGDVIDLTPNYSAFEKMHGEIQGTGTDGKLRIKIINVQPVTAKISPGTIIKVAPNYVKRNRVIDKDEELLEVKMSPSTLEAWAKSPEAEGIRAGFEAEMIFRDTKRDDDDEDMEPDMDYDERAYSIDDVVDFFMNDDYGYGLSDRQAERLRNQLDEAYFEWRDDQIIDAFNRESEDLVREVWLDERPMPERILSALTDGMGLDDEQADAVMELHKRYANKEIAGSEMSEEQLEMTSQYSEARSIANEVLDEEVEASIENQDGYYDQALDNFRDNYDEDDSSFFSDIGLRWMSDIMNEYNLDWPYWTGGSSGGGDRDWDGIAESLHDAVGMDVKVGSGYHSVSRKDDRWIIEPDGSLDPDDSDDMGLEIVSPPMPLPQALEKLRAVIEWGNNEADAYTNSSTGLHMGISIPYVGGDVDYVKLVLFMGDEYILDKFGRASNTYTASAMQKLRQNMAGARNRGELTEAKLDPMGALELVQKNLIELAARYVQQGVGTSKYTSAHIKPGYIEFRSPGGDYLSMESRGEYDDIKNTMLRFARAMYIAGRPDLERKEYAKKLYKLISPGAQDDGLKLFAEYAAGTITPEQLKKQWADAVLQKELPNTGKEEWEAYDQRKSGPDSVIDTFYAVDYDDAFVQARNKYDRTDQWPNIDIRRKQPWFDVYGPDGEIVTTYRARDIDQARDKAQNEFEYWTDDWKVFRRPDESPEPEKKLSRRAEVAKRIKEPKVTPAVAADNAQDSKDLQARVGPYSTGTGNYEIVDRRDSRVVLQYTASSDSDAQNKYNNWLRNQGMPQDTENYGWRIARQNQDNWSADFERRMQQGVQDIQPDVAQNFSDPGQAQRAQNIRDAAPRSNFEFYVHDQPDQVFHRMNNATAEEVRAYIERQEQEGMPIGLLRVRQV